MCHINKSITLYLTSLYRYGHIGGHIDEFNELHGRYGVGQRNFGRKNVVRVLTG